MGGYVGGGGWKGWCENGGGWVGVGVGVGALGVGVGVIRRGSLCCKSIFSKDPCHSCTENKMVNF